MPKVSAFDFYDDATTLTNPSTCEIDWVAGTLSYPGITSLVLAKAGQLADNIDALAGQVISDEDAELQRRIFKSDGTTAVTLTATVDPVAGTVTTVAPGASAFSRTKAEDLAVGLREFVEDEL
jgi:hypothetical protein